MAQHGFDLAGRPAVILIAEENQIAAAGLEGAQSSRESRDSPRRAEFSSESGDAPSENRRGCAAAVGRAVVADDNFPIDGAGLGADGGKLLGEKAPAVIGAHGDGAEHNPASLENVERIFLIIAWMAAGCTKKQGMARPRFTCGASEKKNKEKPQRREARQGFLWCTQQDSNLWPLIRSQTLYPAELWVQFSIFRSFLLGTKSIILHGAKNVNTFFENYFSFSPFGWKRGNLGQNPGDFGGKTGRRK